MTGFELTINGESIAATVPDGVVSIILTKLSKEGSESIDLDFTGLNTSDSNKTEIVGWYKSGLEIGDEIQIKIKKIGEVSKPIRIESKTTESINAQNVEAYYRMKKDLEEKGLI